MNDRHLMYIIISLVIILIITTTVSAFGFFEVRNEIARIQSEGIEACYGLECEYNFLGKVSCQRQRLPEPDYLGLVWNESLGNETAEAKDR